MKLLALFFVAVILYGCSPFFEEYESPEYVKVAHGITFEAAAKLCTEKRLVLIGIGGGMSDSVKCMSLSFQLHHEVDLEEARELSVYATEEFLKTINTNEEIRPNLHHYPFTANDVEIWIWITKPDRRDVPLGEICFVLSKDGRVSYSMQKSQETKRQENYSKPYFLREPYEEALAKVKADQVGED